MLYGIFLLINVCFFPKKEFCHIQLPLVRILLYNVTYNISKQILFLLWIWRPSTVSMAPPENLNAQLALCLCTEFCCFFFFKLIWWRVFFFFTAKKRRFGVEIRLGFLATIFLYNNLSFIIIVKIFPRHHI